MMEMLSIPFVQKALIGGVVLSILLSLLSLFIVVKNWSFISVGISHATFGGLAIGLYLGINPTFTGFLFATFTGLLIGYISKNSNLKEDISIGILFSFSMAIGIIFIMKTSNYTSDLFTFLFGDILTITSLDIKLLICFTVFVGIYLFLFFNKLMFCCFDEEVAYTTGIKTNFYYYSLIVIIAIATVLSVKLVGVILASAMIILPASFASLFFWHYKKILIFGSLTSVVMIITGIFVSYYLDFPPGAFIVSLYSAVFMLGLFIKKVLLSR
ncbi:MAG: metal ABC transporter permease [Hydrogenothermus sp.]|nr:MAG: metal ABC transporter permease [Hydrogenothermus sp.]